MTTAGGQPDIAAARETMTRMTMAGVAALPSIVDSIEQYEISIPTRDGWQSRTIIVRPKSDVAAKRPLFVHFYGGGFMVGEPEQMLNIARAFAEHYGVVVALPSYRLVPEVRWPVPQQDGWDVVAWLSENATKELGANLDEGFIVGGASAGATVAVAIGAIAMFPDSKEAQETSRLAKPLTGQFLAVPFAVVPEIVPSEYKSLFKAWDDNKNAEGLNTPMLEMVLNGLQITDYKSLWASPVPELVKRAPVNKIPIYMEHCQFDALRDDVTIYAKVLETRAVPVKTHLFQEDNHYAWAVSLIPKKGDFEKAGMEGMKWLLSRPS